MVSEQGAAATWRKNVFLALSQVEAGSIFAR